MKNKLFYWEQDYKRFVRNILKYEEQYKDKLNIVNYCLMPNHFHVLILNIKEWFDLANFMRKLQVAYAMYLKKKYWWLNWFDYSWPVFESRYKAKIIDNKEYLEEIKNYIFNNPVKHEYVDSPDKRIWKR